MEVHLSAHAWAQYHFGAAALGDQRRTARLVDSAARIALHPELSFPSIFDWNQLRGFYGLCNRPEATLAAIQQPHWLNTRQEMTQHPLVLILHDTTDLDFTSHLALMGIGPLGDGRGRGLLQHNSLAILPQPRQVLGLTYQQLRRRQVAPKNEHSRRRKKRQRESELWLEGIRAAGRPPPDSCWVDVGDRGADIYEAMRAALEVDHQFLFRLTQDRLVFTTAAHDQTAHLLSYARQLPSQGSDRVDIPGRGGRPARTATVQLAGAPVWVPAPDSTAQRWAQPVLPVWVIRVWEDNPPAEVAEPLEWLLLSSLPAETLAELKERRNWYSSRWLVECYHDVEKNGCSEEERRFETREGLEACLGILAVVAVRVLQLRCALAVQPEAPAEQIATTQEVAVLREYLAQPGRRLTVGEFVRGVGRLGGFLGRRGDGEPGVRALWRGYQRLQDMVVGYQLRQAAAPAGRKGAKGVRTKVGPESCHQQSGP